LVDHTHPTDPTHPVATDTTSVMPRLAMDTAPAMVMEDMVTGATLMCTDLHKDLVHHTHLTDMDTTKLNQSIKKNQKTSNTSSI